MAIKRSFSSSRKIASVVDDPKRQKKEEEEICKKIQCSSPATDHQEAAFRLMQETDAYYCGLIRPIKTREISLHVYQGLKLYWPEKVIAVPHISCFVVDESSSGNGNSTTVVKELQMKLENMEAEIRSDQQKFRVLIFLRCSSGSRTQTTTFNLLCKVIHDLVYLME
ncbi:hypothetical protein H6P81_007664 [Aristolochia fimbriata]|uniref:Uncharacterized protein n=1 Tax=Aristolochia fimbriata TaxID=158543 RepID=A0AAV7F0V9_ARIFI|nr:hypothetical protein H6P81_007664 [Aristolochia fimbriata]